MLHINLIYYLFHHVEFKLERISRIHQLVQKLSSEHDWKFCWIIFQFELHMNLNMILDFPVNS